MAGQGGPGSPGRAAGGRKMSLQRCETCSEEEAKYRCPRCMKYSCSLSCVKKHKLALSCNGVRDKTSFISVNEFTDLNLLSDYRFLEDVGRTADAAARDLSVHRPTTNKFINYLRNRARRHNINLKTLPIGFTKRRENSTIFNKKEQKFYWHLKLVFPHCHAEYTLKSLKGYEKYARIYFWAVRTACYAAGVPEDKMLTDILKPYIDPVESDPVVCQRLKIYTMSPQSDVQILMKIENRKQNSISITGTNHISHGLSYDSARLVNSAKSDFDNLRSRGTHGCIGGLSGQAKQRLPCFSAAVINYVTKEALRYNELDASRSLLENLKNKVIIEYPTLFVVLKKLKNDMVVLGQDASESAEDSDSESSSLSSEEEGEIRESS